MICDQCLYRNDCIVYRFASQDAFIRTKLNTIQQCQRRRVKLSLTQKLRTWLQRALIA